MRSFQIKSYDTEGCPALTIINIDKNIVSIYQRMFYENPCFFPLRKWKGMYYCERYIHIKYGTFKMMHDFIQFTKGMTDKEFEEFVK